MLLIVLFISRIIKGSCGKLPILDFFIVKCYDGNDNPIYERDALCVMDTCFCVFAACGAYGRSAKYLGAELL